MKTSDVAEKKLSPSSLDGDYQPFLQARWADLDDANRLIVDDQRKEFQMAFSQGTGHPLVSYNGFGADIIQFDAGKGVDSHTHDGHHILLVLTGSGIVEYYDEEHDLYPGVVYFIPGNVPHAIRAKTNLVLIAVGNDHRPVDSKDRLTVVEK